ncbi:MAG: ubiquinol-cytochrome c reductase iron-sulfur subunit [Methylotetracoccus sp.]
MMDDEIDREKRRFLTQATVVAGALGAGFVATPFLASMQPSAKARASGAPVEVDVSKVEPGQLIRIMWRGKPVWILRRTPEMLGTLERVRDKLLDPESQESEQPEYAVNEARSRTPEIFVAVGVCTHLGCSPTFRPDVTPADLGPDWLGGFFCPCHGSLFDLAGRVYKGVPAPKNLEIPPYRFLSEGRLFIGGANEEESA